MNKYPRPVSKTPENYGWAPPPKQPDAMRADFHKGMALIRLAETYRILPQVVLEMVQNAVDAEAKRIVVTINKKTHEIWVTDDGNGVDDAIFGQALTSIAVSTKDQKQKLGQFGLGLISPIGKCVKYTFTSRRKGSKQAFRQWVFDSASIKLQHHELSIPCQNRTDIDANVWYNTQTHMLDFTTDSVKGEIKLENLVSDITEKFGAALFKRRAQVVVTVTDENGKREERTISPTDYRGQPLGERQISRKNSKVKFRMFLADFKTAKPNGKVHLRIDGNDYRLVLSKEAMSGLIDSDVLDGITSGIFEGEIIMQGPTLNSSRKFFDADDSLLDAAECIAEWFKSDGKKYAETLLSKQKDEWYKAVGTKSLKVISSLLGENELLKNVLDKIKFGSTGTGHFAHDDEESDTEFTATAVAGQHEGTNTHTPGAKKHSSSKRKKSAPTADKPKHHPMLVIGEDGKPRELVRDDSTGLSFIHGSLSSGKLFKFDIKTGIFTFNIHHPTWVMFSEDKEISDNARGEQIMMLQERIVIGALNLEALSGDEDTKLLCATFLEQTLDNDAWLIKYGDRIAQRGRWVDRSGKEKKK